MLISLVDPCTHVDITYFGPYTLSSMFLYAGSLKLINNYEDKFIVCSDRILTCRIKSIRSPAKGGTGCYRFNYQPGS